MENREEKEHNSHLPIPNSVKQLKVALVHDWLVGGGAERVVEELHKIYPQAPIYTSYCTDEWRRRLDGKVVTGWLQHWPFGALRKYVGVLRIWWFTHLDLSGYDLVISSSGNGEAKGVKTSPNTLHICYCHSPVHYYWRHYDQYMKRPGFGLFDPLARLGLRLLLGPLRRWDLKAAQRPDYYIANSSHIQADIKRYYGRDSVVIHPPVDTKRFKMLNKSSNLRRGFITVGRQTGYKHTDIIVEACVKLGLPLTVMGSGPEHARLIKLAGPTVKFIKGAPDTEVARRLAGAQAFLFAAFEDFGVTPVEAMAAGTAVIAYKAGGALDYVEHGKTGLFFEEQTVESLVKTLEQFNPKQFKSQAIAAKAGDFSPQVFRQAFSRFVQACLPPPGNG